MVDLTAYLHSEEIGTPKRFPMCPFCERKVKSKGFVVTRTPRGYLMWCHLCHTRKFVPSGTPSASVCLDVAKRLGIRSEVVAERNTLVVRLPYDFSSDIPLHAKLWLESYGVLTSEMQRVCGWSERYQRLILCVRDEKGRLLYWTGRYFGTDRNQPKYMNVRNKKALVFFDTKNLCSDDDTSTLEQSEHLVVVVEDIISALAIRRSGFHAIALLGSYLDDRLLSTVLSQYRQVCVWLDSDKRCECAKSAKRFRAIGVDAYAILHTDGDPKDYLETEIQQILSHITNKDVKHPSVPFRNTDKEDDYETQEPFPCQPLADVSVAGTSQHSEHLLQQPSHDQGGE